MSDRIVSIAAFLVPALTCVFLVNLISYAIIGEINRKVLDHDRVTYLFWYPGKFSLILRRYRELYPKGHLALIAVILISFVILFGILGALELSGAMRPLFHF
jgi:hypothetical protein